MKDCGIGSTGGFFLGWFLATMIILVAFYLYQKKEQGGFGGGGGGGGGGGFGGGGGGGGDLPKGWQESKSPDGQTYYYNKATGQTSWERPYQ